MIFLLTIFLIPSSLKLINSLEKLDAKDGVKKFFKNHGTLFKLYLCLFIGIFLCFIILSNVDSSIFDYQTSILKMKGDISDNGRIIMASSDFSLSKSLAITSQNIMVIVVAFLLSIFYGVGGLFLIILNASVFAAYVVTLLGVSSKTYSLVSLISIHMIPEIFGFFIATLAGALISRAIFKEKLGSNEFQNVIRDSLILLFMSALIILIAGMLEIMVVARLIVHLL